MTKKFYWLKLNENFFDDDTIRFIEDQEKGIYYSNFYLKLCLKSIKYEGKLIRLVGEMLIPYDVKALSKLTGVDYDIVKSAMELFSKIGLVKVLDSGEIYLTQIGEMVGSETDKAQIMRKKRAKKKIGNNVTDLLPKCYTEIDIEKDKEKEKKKELHNAQSDNIACEPVITITLNDKSEYPIYQNMIDEWTELYPNVEIMQELRNMKGWCNANPTKRKTKKGIMRFIVGWLSREQDKPKYNKQDKVLPAWYAQTEDDSVKDVDDQDIKKLQEALRKKVDHG